jgi:hypothetical protein
MLHCSIDMSEFKVRRVETMRTLASMTQRAVRIGLAAGAKYASENYVHEKQTGFLTSDRAIKYRVVKATATETQGELSNIAPYARYVEEGTRPHVILPIDYWGSGDSSHKATHRAGKNAGKAVENPTHGAGRGRFLRFRIGNRIIFARYVDHPGSIPYPFMGPAAQYAGYIIERQTETVTIPALVDIWDRS